MGKKTLVFGASLKPERVSNYVIQQLQNKGVEVVAFGLREGEAFDIKISSEADEFDQIDTVTLYIGPKNQSQYYETILNLKPRRVIFNPGTYNPEFIKILGENGIEADVACTLTLLATNQY